MSEIQIIIYCGVGIALFFDFVNGFHDSANSVATVVGTKVLKPIHAVGIAALANFAGPFLFGTAVAAYTRRKRDYTTRVFYCIRNSSRFDWAYRLGSHYLVFWTPVIKQPCIGGLKAWLQVVLRLSFSREFKRR
jgi:hypothetical protein